MDRIECFILIGGASSRMGSDKWRLRLGGQTFVERIAVQLAGIAQSIRVVGGKLDPTELSLSTIPDVYQLCGALGGVHAALSACRSEWAAVVACDLPFVTAPLFARLASFRHDFEAVGPIQSDGIPQPLCALWRVLPCLDRAAQLIQSGERKPVALLQSVRTRWVSFPELADLEAADHFFDNINTPQDYSRASEKGAETRPQG